MKRSQSLRFSSFDSSRILLKSMKRNCLRKVISETNVRKPPAPKTSVWSPLWNLVFYASNLPLTFRLQFHIRICATRRFKTNTGLYDPGWEDWESFKKVPANMVGPRRFYITLCRDVFKAPSNVLDGSFLRLYLTVVVAN